MTLVMYLTFFLQKAIVVSYKYTVPIHSAGLRRRLQEKKTR